MFEALILIFGIYYYCFLYFCYCQYNYNFCNVCQLATYRREFDRLSYAYILPVCAILAIIFNQNHRRPFEYFYAFSLFVESVAILPQLVLLVEQGEVSNMTTNYIICLGSYRALYILNWIYRFFTEEYKPWLAWICGTIQTLLYGDFFYEFFKAKIQGKKMQLPSVDVEGEH